MTHDQLRDELLVAGLDDWLHLADIAWHAQRVSAGGARSDVAVAVEALRDLVEKRLVEIGDVSDGGFFDWDVAPEEAIARVQHGWEALGRDPQAGDVCWVANTKAGDERAREIVDAGDRG